MKKPFLILLVITLFGAAALLSRPRTSIAQDRVQPPSLVSQITVFRGSEQIAQAPASAAARIHLDPRQSLTATVQFTPGSGPVRLRAPEGGLINGQRTIEVRTTPKERDVSFTFDPGEGTGLFFVEASDDRTSETVAEFWIGPNVPRGRPGPALSFD